MKKKLYLLRLTVIFLTLISCDSDDNLNKEIVINESFAILEHSTITTEEIALEHSELESYTYYSIIEGQNLVFSYEKTYEYNPEMIDDEFTDIIRFEIASELDNFEYSDDELKNIKVYYDELSLAPIPTTGIFKGNISGTKINDTTWDIFINVTVVTGFHDNVTRDFVIKNRFNLR